MAPVYMCAYEFICTNVHNLYIVFVYVQALCVCVYLFIYSHGDTEWFLNH